MTARPALEARAPGKVNLCLFVGLPREGDGLHPLVSIVQSLSLADALRLQDAPPGTEQDEVRCPGVSGPNLAAEALAAYREHTGWDAPPQRLTIVKRVPVAAGMGGGSGDAAAALRLAAHAAGRPGDPVLLELAPRLGSDVPAQLYPGRALVTGVGEAVERLPDPEPFGVLILPAGHGLSTPAVYAQSDRMRPGRGAEDLLARAQAVRALAAPPPAPPSPQPPPELLHNDLQAAAMALSPGIEDALADARAAGADHAMVSGSGPTVFGLFDGPEGPARARAAATTLVTTGRHPRAVAAVPVGPEFASPRAGPAAGA